MTIITANACAAVTRMAWLPVPLMVMPWVYVPCMLYVPASVMVVPSCNTGSPTVMLAVYIVPASSVVGRPVRLVTTVVPFRQMKSARFIVPGTTLAS